MSKHIEASHKFFNSLNTGNIEAVLSILDPAITTYEPVGTPANEGHDGFMKWLQGQGSMFSSWATTVKAIHGAGNSTAIVWTGTGTTLSGTDVTLEGVDIHEFNSDGKIVSIKGYFDPTPLMAAFGK